LEASGCLNGRKSERSIRASTADDEISRRTWAAAAVRGTVADPFRGCEHLSRGFDRPLVGTRSATAEAASVSTTSSTPVPAPAPRTRTIAVAVDSAGTRRLRLAPLESVSWAEPEADNCSVTVWDSRVRVRTSTALRKRGLQFQDTQYRGKFPRIGE
jgi:hypothetical protein